MRNCFLAFSFLFTLIINLAQVQIPTDSLETDSVDTISFQNTSRIDCFKKGYADADKYYFGSKKANKNTLITSLIYWPLGLISAIKNSRKDIDDSELKIPQKEFANNLDYYLGYKMKAEKIKKKKIWNRFLLGVGIQYIAYVIIIVSR